MHVAVAAVVVVASLMAATFLRFDAHTFIKHIYLYMISNYAYTHIYPYSSHIQYSIYNYAVAAAVAATFKQICLKRV